MDIHLVTSYCFALVWRLIGIPNTKDIRPIGFKIPGGTLINHNTMGTLEGD